jgi:hypothetical protein
MIVMLGLIKLQGFDLNYDGMVIMDVFLNNIMINNIVISLAYYLCIEPLLLP